MNFGSRFATLILHYKLLKQTHTRADWNAAEILRAGGLRLMVWVGL